MKYELKSILKNKVTFIFIFILVIIGLKAMIQLETSDISQSNAKDLEWNAALIEANIRQEQSGFALQNHSQEETFWFNNLIAYEQWEADSYKEFAKRYREEAISEKERLIFSLKKVICQFNLHANLEKDNLEASVVYKDMMEKYEHILRMRELPFDYEKLVGNPYISDEDKVAYYNSTKKTIEFYFYLLEHDERNLTPYVASPFSFLSIQLSMDQFPSIIVGILILFYTTAIMIESKKNRSIQLVELIPSSKNFIIKHYYFSILICILIVLVFCFGIPILILGIRHGFSGWNHPILIDPKGFYTFQPYVHVGDWSSFGLGKVFSDYQIDGYGNMTASSLVFWPMWKFMVAAFTVSMLKILFLTLVGFGIGLLMKNNWSALLVCFMVAVVYCVSQYVPAGLKWNPFSMKSGWDVTSGWTHMTWLNAILLLSVSTIIVCIVIGSINNKRDFV